MELNADGTRHHNDILFCAFASWPIDWYDQRTAKQAPTDIGSE
ncbi:hypothetical protein HYP71_gp082 [Arthrobacter phage KBurrousTX]|uniref:Uncharacterized protein n=1 Tax=Arthrobacter phage KBurrousTX TaxID=2315608 RepID=A0A386KBE3_9CAUD|nr:hypothetical protein HYP71_gp082 [Arthrobacter phage KBurrousTX]AYD81576.1 hypothetical protein KBurrousTX_82 [Arthrobacter phage KBurrousTX]